MIWSISSKSTGKVVVAGGQGKNIFGEGGFPRRPAECGTSLSSVEIKAKQFAFIYAHCALIDGRASSLLPGRILLQN